MSDLLTRTSEAPPTEKRPRRTRKPRRTGRVSVWLSRAALVVLVLGCWELLADAGTINVRFVGQPSGVWDSLVTMLETGELVDPTIDTLWATLVALLIAVPSGILAGLVLAEAPFLDKVISPFLIPVNSLPRIAFAPLFLLWFGLTIWSKVFLAVSIVFFMMLFNTRAGVKGVQPDQMAVAKTLGLKRHEVMWKLALPSAVPAIAAGVRLSVTYSLLGVVASEMVAAKQGLGLSVVQFSNAFDINSMLAVLAVMAVIATVLGLIAEKGEQWLLRWE
ncbi:ABC transporter permease [Actinomadura sp. KC345]|uniref:ABC transporter permease n=1 Tax=Actinomadura sp. KC345 TaxID=2530371 RepID=UPI00104F6239|nr:ABC transporter permease [Actinomadura sp. KC345]TDC55480.1 ABC transporter permease [Actinomadura sp. KC345]